MLMNWLESWYASTVVGCHLITSINDVVAHFIVSVIQEEKLTDTFIKGKVSAVRLSLLAWKNETWTCPPWSIHYLLRISYSSWDEAMWACWVVQELIILLSEQVPEIRKLTYISPHNCISLYFFVQQLWLSCFLLTNTHILCPDNNKTNW